MPGPAEDRPNPAEQWDAAHKRRLVVQAKLEGKTYEEAARLAGYAGRASASAAVREALKYERESLVHDLVELRQIEDARDDDLRRKCYAVINSPHHYVLYKGEIVNDPEGVPLEDAGPVLAAIDRLDRIASRYALRHGLNEPVKFDLALAQRVDAEAATVADVVFAIVDELGLPPDMRLAMLTAAQRRLELVASQDVNHTDPEE